MIQLVKETISGQFGAALKMLGDSIEMCPAADWEKPVGEFPFWHVAYHTLFYTNFYLSKSHDTFGAQPFHRENYNFFGRHPMKAELKFVVDQPYDRGVLTGYVQTCRVKAAEVIARETEASLAGPSGFPWVQFSRLQLHFYNIRHIAHHTGQLSAFFRQNKLAAPNWVGTHGLA